MAKKFTKTQEAILCAVQRDLPETKTPFADIAAIVGVLETEVLELLNSMKKTGEIRRFGATLRHQKAGYSHNAMVAWRIPEERDEEAIGSIMASRPEISHCYIRRTTKEWTYNLYTMIHGKEAGEHEKVVAELKKATGLTDYAVLESLKELKKTSMVYFKKHENA